MLTSGQAYMKIANIDGEEPYGSTLKMIRISGFRHGLVTPIAPLRPSVGAQATLRRSYCEQGEFTVFKAMDLATTKIYDVAQRSAVIPQVAIYMCRSTTSSSVLSSGEFGPAPFLSIVLSNAVISSFVYELEGAWPTERLDFHYTSLSWIMSWVSPQDGSAENLGAVGWNGTTNQPTPPYTATNSIPSAVKWSTSPSL